MNSSFLWACIAIVLPFGLPGCERSLEKPFVYCLDKEFEGPVLVEIKAIKGSLLREADTDYEITVNADGYGAITTADRDLMAHWAPPSQVIVNGTRQKVQHWGGEAASTHIFIYVGEKEPAFDFLYGHESFDRKLQILKKHGVPLR